MVQEERCGKENTDPNLGNFMDAKSIVESIDYTSKDIDLIVIGTRGRTGLKRFLTGSVANGVVQHAHCSVMIVR